MINFKSRKNNFANQFTSKQYFTILVIAILILLLATLASFFKTIHSLSSGLMAIDYFIWADLLIFRLCRTKIYFFLCLIIGSIIPGLFLLAIEIILSLTVGN